MAKEVESARAQAHAHLREQRVPLSVPVCNGVYLLFWRVDVFYRIFACSGRV